MSGCWLTWRRRRGRARGRRRRRALGRRRGALGRWRCIACRRGRVSAKLKRLTLTPALMAVQAAEAIAAASVWGVEREQREYYVQHELREHLSVLQSCSSLVNASPAILHCTTPLPKACCCTHPFTEK